MNLADRFIAVNGEPISFDGELAYWTYWLPVGKGTKVTFRLLDHVASPIQGMGLYGEKCQLEINGQTGRHFVLWTDSAPERSEVSIVTARKDARLGVYNVWRDPTHGSTMARLNSAAMRVRPTSDRVVLHCSDGWGAPDFRDLVTELSVETP